MQSQMRDLWFPFCWANMHGRVSQYSTSRPCIESCTHQSEATKCKNAWTPRTEGKQSIVTWLKPLEKSGWSHCQVNKVKKKTLYVSEENALCLCTISDQPKDSSYLSRPTPSRSPTRPKLPETSRSHERVPLSLQQRPFQRNVDLSTPTPLHNQLHLFWTEIEHKTCVEWCWITLAVSLA